MDKRDIEYVKNILRIGTVTWHSRTECLNRGRRLRVVGKYANGKDKTLWERACDKCGEWYLLKDNLLEVDHREEIGPFNGDWNEFLERMYCSVDNLDALCIPCHKRKTSNFNATLKFKRKNETTGDCPL